ncbi:histo-blood group ABO system transferase 1-like [Mesocricetus auratus]|uniref:Histo-blood group ABO system transferase 1-like n=1 Tax=Mesocricetus auratus TaxID=10036 RepID=A0ABM2WTE2_MESAU|nr:histo-blood group ABO system transferase 1-like [Mesocricetus auratus]
MHFTPSLGRGRYLRALTDSGYIYRTWAMARPLWALCRQYSSLRQVTFLLITLLLAIFGYGYWRQKSQIHKSELIRASVASEGKHRLRDTQLSKLIYPQPSVLTPTRRDVIVLTSWLAPIVWEGTFNIGILNKQFQLQNDTIGLTVFALRNHTVYLEQFLRSADTFFMVGYRVNFYVFTDQPHAVPRLPLRDERKVITFQIPSFEHSLDNSMQRMKFISVYSKQRLREEVAYLVCSDVDVTFQNAVGVEILSPLFATLHLSFYMSNREVFRYERRPKSQAYIPKDEGDFYYTGSLFGGSVAEIHRLTAACHQMIVTDKSNNIEALWHDESYLNKYLLYHKPTKILSSEYMFNKKMAFERWVSDHLNLFSLIRNAKILELPEKRHADT